MNYCCTTAYTLTFDRKRALREMDQYLKNGPKKSTNYLIGPLKDQALSGTSLLDIGGGTGAIILELFGKEVDRAYYLEISHAYAEVFRDQVVLRSLEEHIEIQIGELTENHLKLPRVDVVTLDKVICCYEDYQQLVKLSLQKARKLYAYTIPRDVWWVRAANSVSEFFKSLFSNQLPTYVHPVAVIEKMVLELGFEKIYQKTHREWLTVIYSKGLKD